MRHLSLIAVLVSLPFSANAKKPAEKASSTKKAEVRVSTAALGIDLPSYSVSTAPITLDLISKRFAEVDREMKSLRADYRQFVRMDGSDAVQAVEGEVSFQKPDLLRMVQSLPEPQTVVSDGTWLWVYRKSTNQVIQTRLETWRKSEPLAKGLLDFGRSADLLKNYQAVLSTVAAPGEDGHRRFSVLLTPRPEDRKGSSSGFELTLKASTRDFFPGEAELRVGNTSIHSNFSNVRLNADIPAETFQFSPPPNADVFQTPSPRP